MKRLGVATLGSATLATTATANGKGGRGKGRGGGFPPSGITSWGDTAPLGEGEIRTFASTTPSGTPKYVGLQFTEGVLPNLPSAETLAAQGGGPWNGGLVAKLHGGLWSKLHNLDFPDAAPAPMEYVGFGWNSQGHLPFGVYSKPHFDVHFYFHGPGTIGAIGPRNPAPDTPDPITHDDIADGQIPEGYRLIEGGAVIPKMGAHLAPEDAPEFDDRDDASDWLETLMWGVADVDGDETFELNFVEPMITVDYFENHLDGVVKSEIAQPESYPMDGWYPTTYAVRDLGDGGYAVVMEEFEQRES